MLFGCVCIVAFLVTDYFSQSFETKPFDKNRYPSDDPNEWRTWMNSIKHDLQTAEAATEDDVNKIPQTVVLTTTNAGFLQTAEAATEDDVNKISQTVVLTTTNAGFLQTAETVTEDGISKIPQTVVLTTTNAGYLDITENMLESIKRTGAFPNITVIAEDRISYEALVQRAKSHPGLYSEISNAPKTPSHQLAFNSANYNRLVNKRPAYVLSLLEKGNRVLFADVDTYWFHDPLKGVVWNFDIALHNEFVEPEHWFCDGFVYYSPTDRTINLVRKWALLLATIDTDTPDQHILNWLISNEMVSGLKVKTLQARQFPDGRKYFSYGWKKEDAIVVHLSYIIGHDEKVNTLQRHGLWVM